ncbi:MAG: CoA transferase [Thermoanaerobaculia bacterium]|nr:CoA transferase [Thermoanaerobaculia bacterium]
MSRSLPLHELVVVDFSRILAGPLCTMLLGDAGARVIKVEEPELGDETRRWGPPFAGGESAYYLSANRNKENISIDLKTGEGQDKARGLVEQADVVVDNFLDPQKERLDLTAERVRSLNPRVVHCSIRGYDRDSPEADLPGFDLLAQAAGGLMAITGEPDGRPMKVGVALADVLTAHYAHGAILHSLYARERTGEGASIELSLFGCTVASLVNVGQSFLVTGEEAKRYGNEHPSIVPYQTFRASDGEFALGAASDRQYRKLCRDVLEAPELAEDERFRTNPSRVEHRATLGSTIEEITLGRPVAEWVARCRAADLPVAPVATISSILGERDGPGRPVESIEHPTIGMLEMVRSPIVRNGQRYPIRKAPPEMDDER